VRIGETKRLNAATTSNQSMPPDQTEWTKKSSLFFEHWNAQRIGTDFPTSQRMLDTPNPRLQPQVFLFERAAENKTVFRLMATELVTIWGKDFTGMAVEEVFSPEVAQRYLADPWACHTHSCGLWERGRFGDMRDRVVTLEMMYLPLAPDGSKAPRLIGVLAWTGLSTERASRRGLIAIEDRRWVDVGFGIPSIPPVAVSA
jgi:hypothetical protein